MRFVETTVFTAQVLRHLEDDVYRALQRALVLRPEQGALIPGTGGLRKLRWRTGARGKRSGVRTIDYWAVADDVCYMLFMYAKRDQNDLTPQQLRRLARAVREEFS